MEPKCFSELRVYWNDVSIRNSPLRPPVNFGVKRSSLCIIIFSLGSVLTSTGFLKLSPIASNNTKTQHTKCSYKLSVPSFSRPSSAPLPNTSSRLALTGCQWKSTTVLISATTPVLAPT
ncbi:hypothetical protein E4U26_006297 [Claviceps purpurea]|nr:hypothetical protein E4U26_006297 [Claviceps purpurea]